MSALELVPLLAEKYANRPQAHLISLRSIRPFPGIWITSSDISSHDSDAQPIETRRREYNTRGVDISIVVIRVLFSYGYTFECDNTTSKRVKAILGVASRDLGFDQSIDWKLKRHIYIAWGCSPGTSHTITFRDMLREQRLFHMFAYHPAFQLVSFHTFIQRETGGDFEYTLLEKTNRVFQWKNTPRYRGQSPLSEFIWSHFQPCPLDGVTYQLTGQLPEFLLVRYAVREAPGHTISTLRTFHCEVPVAQKTDGGWVLGRYSAQYQLCMVVRLAPADQDSLFAVERIRVYAKSGEEIPPAEVTPDFRLKEPEATEDPWTIEDVGEYALFYFRVTPDTTGKRTELRSQAPEFTERVWVEHDQKHQNQDTP
jgi:hypothetical protein